MSREGTEIILIDNIGVVAEQSDAEDEITMIKNVHNNRGASFGQVQSLPTV